MTKREPNRLASAVSLLEEPSALSFTLTARARRVLLDAGASPGVLEALGLDEAALVADAARLKADRDGLVPAPKLIRW